MEALDSSIGAGPGAVAAGSAQAAAAPAARTSGIQRQLRRVVGVPEVGIMLVILVAFTGFTLINGAFATGPNIQSLFLTMSYTGIIAIGMAVLMIAGEFDLSVGSVAGMAAIIAGILMTDGGLPVPVAMAVTILIGGFVGLVNGVLTVKVRIPAFVVTLSMLFIAKGIGYLISRGDPVYPLPPDAGFLARTDIFGLPSSIVVYLVLVVIADLAMRHTTLGRLVYATGGNPRTSALAGIRTDRVRMAAFVLCASMASLGGILLMSRLQRADASIGQGWELNVIAACVVGGVALGGGAGTILGTFLGLLLLQGVLQGLVIIGVNPLLQPVAYGIVLAAAACFDLYRRRRFA
jgi:ribose transport system permease protein